MLPRRILAVVVTVAVIVGPMVLSAAAIMWFLARFGGDGPWSWQRRAIVIPLAYLGWLMAFLITSAVMHGLIGARWPKPRRVVFGPGIRMDPADVLGLMTVGLCYQGFSVVHSLPLARAFGNLALLAYSSSVHFGQRVRNWGYLYDPDLIHLGDRVLIGGRALVVAHTVTVRPDGSSVYVAAPVRIGSRATIGGDSLVSLGCVIGEDAVVESGAVMAPFTQVGPGEVWGGNPAVFRRIRDDIADAAASAAVSVPAAVTSAAPVAVMPGPGAPISADSVRQLVMQALSLSPDRASDDLSSETCAAWDSLGQVAIAAAIYDRHGISVGPAEVFRLRTLRDVAAAIDAPDPARPLVPTKGKLYALPPSQTSEPHDDPPNGLPRDLELLPLLDPQESSRILAAHADLPPAATVRLSVGIAASFTAEPIAPALKLWARAFGLDVECRFAGFNQIVQTLLGGDGSTETDRAPITVVLARPEDLTSDAAGEAMTRVDRLLEAVSTAAGRPGRGRLLVGNLPPVVSAFAGPDKRQLDPLRERFRAGLETIPGIECFDFAAVVESLGIDRSRSSQSEVLTRGPYSPELYQRLAIALVRQICSAIRSPAKVIALDCDNTLWGGVVGEAGLDGLELGSDGPGRSFQLFQRYLKHLKARGLLLVVVSKNEERDVREVFANHPGMVLTADDIAAWRVNWRHKSENLRELAGELNLGLDAFVFLDDDPVSRLEVETRLSEVHVIPLPVSPAEYCDTLARLWLFDGTRPTAVDVARTQMMKEEQRRQQASASAATLADFLASLELRAQMRVAGDRDWARVAQLTQRTNQFNLSLKRRTIDALKALEIESIVLVLDAADRFGDYGLVGVCVLTLRPDRQSAEIDTFLMSCRALGRGVEDAFLHGVSTVAAENGAAELVASYVEGSRNQQILDFLARTGFEERQPNVWSRSLRELPPPARHVQFHRVGEKPRLVQMPAARNDAPPSPGQPSLADRRS